MTSTMDGPDKILKPAPGDLEGQLNAGDPTRVEGGEGESTLDASETGPEAQTFTPEALRTHVDLTAEAAVDDVDELAQQGMNRFIDKGGTAEQAAAIMPDAHDRAEAIATDFTGNVEATLKKGESPEGLNEAPVDLSELNALTLDSLKEDPYRLNVFFDSVDQLERMVDKILATTKTIDSSQDVFIEKALDKINSCLQRFESQSLAAAEVRSHVIEARGELNLLTFAKGDNHQQELEGIKESLTKVRTKLDALMTEVSVPTVAEVQPEAEPVLAEAPAEIPAESTVAEGDTVVEPVVAEAAAESTEQPARRFDYNKDDLIDFTTLSVEDLKQNPTDLIIFSAQFNSYGDAVDKAITGQQDLRDEDIDLIREQLMYSDVVLHNESKFADFKSVTNCSEHIINALTALKEVKENKHDPREKGKSLHAALTALNAAYRDIENFGKELAAKKAETAAETSAEVKDNAEKIPDAPEMIPLTLDFIKDHPGTLESYQEHFNLYVEVLKNLEESKAYNEEIISDVFQGLTDSLNQFKTLEGSHQSETVTNIITTLDRAHRWLNHLINDDVKTVGRITSSTHFAISGLKDADKEISKLITEINPPEPAAEAEPVPVNTDAENLPPPEAPLDDAAIDEALGMNSKKPEPTPEVKDTKDQDLPKEESGKLTPEIIDEELKLKPDSEVIPPFKPDSKIETTPSSKKNRRGLFQGKFGEFIGKTRDAIAERINAIRDPKRAEKLEDKVEEHYSKLRIFKQEIPRLTQQRDSILSKIAYLEEQAAQGISEKKQNEIQKSLRDLRVKKRECETKLDKLETKYETAQDTLKAFEAQREAIIGDITRRIDEKAAPYEKKYGALKDRENELEKDIEKFTGLISKIEEKLRDKSLRKHEVKHWKAKIAEARKLLSDRRRKLGDLFAHMTGPREKLKTFVDNKRYFQRFGQKRKVDTLPNRGGEYDIDSNKSEDSAEDEDDDLAEDLGLNNNSDSTVEEGDMEEVDPSRYDRFDTTESNTAPEALKIRPENLAKYGDAWNDFIRANKLVIPDFKPGKNFLAVAEEYLKKQAETLLVKDALKVITSAKSIEELKLDKPSDFAWIYQTYVAINRMIIDSPQQSLVNDSLRKFQNSFIK
ncbi:MAG: hypothetical protein V4519_04680 [Patescibacteria group bacterium]